MSYPIAARLKRSLTDFEIGEVLGDGSLSEVHVAVEVQSGRKFAVKIFNRQFLRSNRKEADVSMEEHCLRRLNHPGIVKMHASFADDISRYMVLEYCPGGELWNMVRDSGSCDEVARHYLAQIVEALSFLRDTGIVHRDIKAENVLIGASGNAKLVDFGSAKDLHNPHITGAGTRNFNKTLMDNVGTANFMAPEVVKNKFSDHRSDIWSFGCMVFQVLTGLAPFGTNLLKVYERSLKAKLPLPPGLSEEASDLIRKIVVLNPNNRLGSLDARELKGHAFFRAAPPCGQRFEGMCRAAAPVPSLTELCLRALGRRWGALAGNAEDHPALQEGAGLVRREVLERIARLRLMARREAARERRRQRALDGRRRGPDDPEDSSTATDIGETRGAESD